MRPYRINSCSGYINIMIDNVQPITVVDPCAMPRNITFTTTTANCGLAMGSATAYPSGGTTPYTYQWNNGQTGQTATSLHAGTYSVTVTDGDNCTFDGSVTVSGSGSLSSSINNVVNETCLPGGDGSIDLNVSGGTPPYTYLWSNGATTQDIFNLSAGTYTVNVTDQNGCVSSNTATISSGQPYGPSGIWTWIGIFNDNWFKPCNWDKASVPDINKDVRIEFTASI